MKLVDAQSVVREVSGKSFSWLKAWGLGTIKEAIRTIEDRVSSTHADREYASDVKTKIWRGY
jgi:hypothetical protein